MTDNETPIQAHARCLAHAAQHDAAGFVSEAGAYRSQARLELANLVGLTVRYSIPWILENVRRSGRKKPDRPLSFWTDSAPGIVREVRHHEKHGAYAVVDWGSGELHHHPIDGRLVVSP